MFHEQLNDLASPGDIVNFNWLINDPNLTNAISIVQKDVCYTYEKKMILTCSWSEGEIGDILLSYISILTDENEKKTYPKSFFDESENDRKDPYRAKLVKRVSQVSRQTESKVLTVLTALYWAIKDGRLNTNVILKPNETGYDKKSAQYGVPIIGPLVKSGKNILDATGNVLASAGEGAADTVNAIGKTLQLLPWILGAAAVVVVFPVIAPYLLGAKKAANSMRGK